MSELQETVGFEQVNEHVRQALVQWIGGVVRQQFQMLLKRQALKRPEQGESGRQIIPI